MACHTERYRRSRWFPFCMILFGESQSRIVVSVSPEQETDFLDFMIESGIHFSTLGHVTKQELRIDDVSFGFISDYAREFESALEKLMGE